MASRADMRLAQTLRELDEANERVAKLEAQVAALQRELAALRARTPRHEDDYPQP